VSAIAPANVPLLEGLDVWILDALRYRPHPSHFALADALRWIDQLKPKRAILTNMHSDLDYEKLRRELPPHVEPAHDGLTIELAEATA
jgi:phosphoribosyl 1,2-cyclic phosphate phosphodiesterase